MDAMIWNEAVTMLSCGLAIAHIRWDMMDIVSILEMQTTCPEMSMLVNKDIS